MFEPFEQLTVFIEFRFKAGATPPACKALRARVMQGESFGNDLVPQFCIDVANVKKQCYRALSKHAKRIQFHLDPVVRSVYPKVDEK